MIVLASDTVLGWLRQSEDYELDDFNFFPVDYDKNILEDEVYLSLDRGICYNRYGNMRVLTENNIAELHPTAGFFYRYFNCIINGDYEAYPSFYTDACLNDPNFNCPEKFTTQGLYDIDVNLFSVSGDETTKEITEVYRVSYRIFENNGTYRRDILQGETRTRVFEIKINNGIIKINSIGYSVVSK